MDDSFTSKAVINNEYDFSNILPTIEAILYLTQYCDEMNNQLTKLTEKDEEKNKPLKYEYKNYTYKHSYGQQFEVYIISNTYNTVSYNDYQSFKTAVNSKQVSEVGSLIITLCLDFHRGIGNDIEEHENSFIISFKPYEIKFIRKSNHNDQTMDQVEQQIISILKQFPVANCIFCNKQ